MIKKILFNKHINSFESIAYFSNTKSFNYNQKIFELPKGRMDRFLKLENEEEKKRFVAVWILLKKAFKLQKLNIDDYKFTYSDKGKPLLIKSPIDFSVSHSGNYVAVILSYNSVGIDIQKKQKISQNLVNFTCNQYDQEFLEDSKNKIDAFFDIWCLKEAYSKMTGNGLITSFKNIKIDYKNKEKSMRFETLNFVKGYKMGMFSKQNCSFLLKKLNLH